ncbi:MgtC/SapB family protein [Tundrisphaera sp. TA3]|uniref:MgtC/SapB family protein n=1 Tax=Tundrisphaera sp. TA3 TaxID=3435775 RepID=UPI003EBD57E5
MFETIFRSVVGEFSDLSLPHAVRLAVRLLVAALMGGLLGWDRERAGKAAGLRTHILVATGAAAFMAIPQQSGLDPNGLSRVLQGLIAGIGFLGAGCIMKGDTESQVRGLTTAAGIWLTAGVGVAAGMGRDMSALLLGGFGYFTLSAIGRWERKLGLDDLSDESNRAR